jgi:hypothetical protein
MIVQGRIVQGRTLIFIVMQQGKSKTYKAEIAAMLAWDALQITTSGHDGYLLPGRYLDPPG